MSTQGNGTDLGIFTAAADLSAKQFCGVIISGNFAVNIAGAGVAAFGILQNKPGSGQAATVRILGVSKAVAGAAVAAGADLMCDANGNLITATSTNAIVAKAVNGAGGAGEIISVLLSKTVIKP